MGKTEPYGTEQLTIRRQNSRIRKVLQPLFVLRLFVIEILFSLGQYLQLQNK